MPSKVLPGNETVLLIPAVELNGVPYAVTPSAEVAISAITSAVLNYYIPVTTNAHANAGHGGNVSCATRDDLALGLTDSDTDDSRTICSIGQAETPTFYNFEADFAFFHDATIASTSSVFEMATDLVRAPDIKYIIAHRIGFRPNVTAAAGQEWDFYYAWTDNPVPEFEDGGKQFRTQSFVPKNLVNIAYTLGS